MNCLQVQIQNWMSPLLELDDESTKILLCAGGDADDVSPEMKEFLDWMVHKRKGRSRFVKRLDEAVQKARNHEEWRLEYMTLLMRDNKMREEGRLAGRKEGRREGRRQGRAESIIDSIRNIRDSLGLSVEEAMDALKIPENERKNYINKL